MAATSLASFRALARRSTNSRRICSMYAERETFGPASLSMLATRSSDSVRDVFAFILPLYYQSRIPATCSLSTRYASPMSTESRAAEHQRSRYCGIPSVRRRRQSPQRFAPGCRVERRQACHHRPACPWTCSCTARMRIRGDHELLHGLVPVRLEALVVVIGPRTHAAFADNRLRPCGEEH